MKRNLPPKYMRGSGGSEWNGDDDMKPYYVREQEEREGCIILIAYLTLIITILCIIGFNVT